MKTNYLECEVCDKSVSHLDEEGMCDKCAEKFRVRLSEILDGP